MPIAVPASAPTELRAAAPAEGDRARRASLRYLNFFRLVLAGLFLVAGQELGLGKESPSIYLSVAFAYLGAVLALGFPDAARRLGHASREGELHADAAGAARPAFSRRSSHHA